MNNPLVSVVICVWNRRDDIIETLPSIYEQAYENYEIIIVDNGSTDGLVEILEAEHPDVRVVALNENLGPTGGRNAGIDIALGEIIFFLDSDASLLDDTLQKVADRLAQDPTIGVIDCNVINLDPNETAGWSFNADVDRDKEFFGFSFSETGCAIRKETLDKAGPFWEYLFYGREGEELGLRIWDAGYKILYYPDAIIHHRASPQTRVTGSRREFFDLRNCYYIYMTRYPWRLVPRFLLMRTGVAFVRGIKRRNFFQVPMKALGALVRNTPELLRQRAPISNETAAHYMELQRDHGPLSWSLSSWVRNKV